MILVLLKPNTAEVCRRRGCCSMSSFVPFSGSPSSSIVLVHSGAQRPIDECSSLSGEQRYFLEDGDQRYCLLFFSLCVNLFFFRFSLRQFNLHTRMGWDGMDGPCLFGSWDYSLVCTFRRILLMSRVLHCIAPPKDRGEAGVA